MSLKTMLPKFNYEQLSFDSVYAHFYGKKFTPTDLLTLHAIIEHRKHILVLNSKPRTDVDEKLENWFHHLKSMMIYRGELEE